MKKETKETLLAATLITPLALAAVPTAAHPIKAAYSHSTQVGEGIGNNWCTNTFTANGTRTYDYRGQPSDADSDNDQNCT